jgi:oligoribonuclease
MSLFLWLDCEMSGLDFETHRILEVALVATDKKLNALATFDSAVFQTPEHLAIMDSWCTKTHTESGLVKRVATGVSEQSADEKLAEIITKLVPNPTKETRPILCGNSIWQDRKFVDKYFPKFASLLHYRMLDVSTLKILFESYKGVKFKKQNKHTAVDDIYESISELKFYLDHLGIEIK